LKRAGITGITNEELEQAEWIASRPELGPIKTLVVMEAVGQRNFGKAAGYVEGLGLIPGVVGPLAAGACVDATGSFLPAFYTIAGSFVVGVWLMVLSIWAQPENKNKNNNKNNNNNNNNNTNNNTEGPGEAMRTAAVSIQRLVRGGQQRSKKKLSTV
jgi:hypothetical protein